MKGTRSSRLPSPAIGMKQQKLHSAQKSATSAHLYDQNTNNGTPISKNGLKLSRCSDLLQTIHELVSSHVTSVCLRDFYFAKCCLLDTYITHRVALEQPDVDIDHEATDLAFFNQLSYLLLQPASLHDSTSLLNLLSTLCEAHSLTSSKPSISTMNQMQLTELLLFLSWNEHTTVEYFQQYCSVDNIVNELMKTLSDRKKNPKDLSMAVACVAFLVQHHSLCTKILSTANAIQLLKVCLSKSVYASEVSPEQAAECVLPLAWEFIGARLGLIRLLRIPTLDTMNAVQNEMSSFLRKWWQRLSQAVTLTSTAFPTPSKTNGVSAVRCALEVIGDLLHGEVVQKVVVTFIEEDVGLGDCEREAVALRVLGHYMISEDYRTSYAASRVLLGILLKAEERSIFSSTDYKQQIGDMVISAMSTLLRQQDPQPSHRTPLRDLATAIPNGNSTDEWDDIILEPMLLCQLDILHVISRSSVAIFTPSPEKHSTPLIHVLEFLLKRVNVHDDSSAGALVWSRLSIGVVTCLQLLAVANQQYTPSYFCKQLEIVRTTLAHIYEAADMEAEFGCSHVLKQCRDRVFAESYIASSMEILFTHIKSLSRTPRMSSLTPINTTTPSDISLATPKLQSQQLIVTTASIDIPPPPPEAERSEADEITNDMTPEIVDRWVDDENRNDYSRLDDSGMDIENDPTSVTISRLSISDKPHASDANSAPASTPPVAHVASDKTLQITNTQKELPQQSINELTRRLSAAEASLAAMQEENRRIIGENVKLQSTVVTLTSRCDSVSHEHMQTQQNLEEAWQKLKSFAIGEENRRKELSECNARCKALESSLEISQHEVSIKCSELAAAKSEVRSMSDALRQAHITEANLRTEKGRLQSEQLEYRHREEELRLQLDMSKQQCCQYSDAIKESRQKYAAQEQQLHSMASELESALDQLAAEKKKFAIASSEQASKAAKWQETEISLRQQIASQMEAIQSAAKVHQRQQEKAQQMESTLRQELDKSKKECSKNATVMEDLKRQLEKQSAKISDLEMVVDDQQLKYEEQISELADATNEIQNLRNELSKHRDLISYINKLSAEADAAKSKRESVSK